MDQNKKEEFTEAEIRIVEFDNEDVITTSDISKPSNEIELPEIRFWYGKMIDPYRPEQIVSSVPVLFI